MGLKQPHVVSWLGDGYVHALKVGIGPQVQVRNATLLAAHKEMANGVKRDRPSFKGLADHMA